MHEEQSAEYEACLRPGLKLDLTRGKPSPAQLDLSNELLTLPGEGNYTDATGTDCRNYGGTRGCRRSGRSSRRCSTFRSTNSWRATIPSLSIMHDTLVYALLRAPWTSAEPWSSAPIKFLCPGSWLRPALCAL